MFTDLFRSLARLTYKEYFTMVMCYFFLREADFFHHGEPQFVFKEKRKKMSGFYKYVNVSVVIKFSLKTSGFYLNYHKISIKSYVVDVY